MVVSEMGIFQHRRRQWQWVEGALYLRHTLPFLMFFKSSGAAVTFEGSFPLNQQGPFRLEFLCGVTE